MPKLTARQRKVIRTGAANVADVYDLTATGERRFRRAAKRAIRKPGVSAKSKAYRQTIVQADRKTTTKAEAKGAKRVLRRADQAGSTPRARHNPKAGSASPHRIRNKKGPHRASVGK